MPLFPIVRDTSRRLYCGPTAICAVTGETALYVLKLIDSFRGVAAYRENGVLKGVRSMHRNEIVEILRLMKYRVVMNALPHEPTFASYLKQMAEQGENAGPRIVRMRGHFIAVGSGGADVCDTLTKQPVPASQAPKRRARITDEILISPSC